MSIVTQETHQQANRSEAGDKDGKELGNHFIQRIGYKHESWVFGRMEIYAQGQITKKERGPFPKHTVPLHQGVLCGC